MQSEGGDGGALLVERMASRRIFGWNQLSVRASLVRDRVACGDWLVLVPNDEKFDKGRAASEESGPPQVTSDHLRLERGANDQWLAVRLTKRVCGLARFVFSFSWL